MLSKFEQVNIKARHLWEGLGGDRRTVVEWLLLVRGIGFIRLRISQDRDYWRALVNATLNLQVP